MPFITTRVYTPGPLSKKRPDNDHLAVEALERQERMPEGEWKKYSSMAFTQMRKISKAIERVRSHRCESLGKCSMLIFSTLLDCFL